MKFLVAITLIATVASATPVRPIGQLLEAISALRPPTAAGPAGAAGPAIVEPFPVAVGPEIVQFPLPEGALGEVPAAVAPSPVSIVEGPAPASDASSPALVQIILNINQASAGVVPVDTVIGHEPVHVDEIVPTPVQVVESAPIAVDPVQVVEIAPEPVQVVEVAPVPVEPVIIGTPVLPSPVVIGTPVLPSPAITLPEELN